MASQNMEVFPLDVRPEVFEASVDCKEFLVEGYSGPLQTVKQGAKVFVVLFTVAGDEYVVDVHENAL